jgi:cytochrome c oxidase cbb3-type subunit 2
MKGTPVLKLTALSALFFVLGIAVTIMLPAHEAPGPSPLAERYSEEEARGKKIYEREGCWYCHTQQVRAPEAGIGTVHKLGDIGPESLPGDSFYDRPSLWGTQRQGPDLAHVASRKPYGSSIPWHVLHLRMPGSMYPGTLMPSFDHLSDDELHALAAYLVTLK